METSGLKRTQRTVCIGLMSIKADVGIPVTAASIRSEFHREGKFVRFMFTACSHVIEMKTTLHTYRQTDRRQCFGFVASCVPAHIACALVTCIWTF